MIFFLLLSTSSEKKISLFSSQGGFITIFFFLNKRLTACRTFEEPLIYYKHAWISLDSKEYAKCAILSPECFCTWLNVISPAPWSENSCVRRSAAAGGCEGNYSLILLS